ncbi:MAG TPA: SNF2-related protein, partial [Aquella sp.]|nr:SNF2-related protein [Aquella sp.]
MGTLIKDLSLASHQIDAFRRTLEIFAKSHAGANNSGPGTGKTYTTMATFLYMRHSRAFGPDSKLFVLCPANAVLMWEEKTSEYQIPAIIISYRSLIGKGDTISHKYLIKQNGIYHTTPDLIKLINNQILLVLDESQETKNSKSNTFKACHAIVKEVTRINNASRILLLSATPVDKEDYVESIVKLLGIITVDDLYRYDKGSRNHHIHGLGFDQLYNFCMRLNPVLTRKLYPNNINAGSVRHAIYEMYTQIVKGHLAFSMPNPNLGFKFHGYSRYYNLEPEALFRLKQSLQDLKTSIGYGDDGTIKYTANGIAGVIRSFMLMESAKIGLFYRLVQSALTENSNTKVILYVWHD